MNLQEDVIIDLLPLYFSGEGSSATCTLVEAYFADHPAFATTMRAAHANALPILDRAQQDMRAGEKAAVQGLRKTLRWRSTSMALAIFFSLAPFSFTFKNGESGFFMLKDHPGQALAFAGIGVCFWIAFFMFKRRTDRI